VFKKTIKFTDFNGTEQEQDFYFHLSKAEIAALSHGANALQERMRRLERAQDGVAILNEMREIIRLCCGRRSEDGARFLKTPEAQSDLLDSPAFDELLLELMDANKMVEFFKQLLPKELQEELFKQVAERTKTLGADPLKNPPNPERPGELVNDPRPVWEKENRKPTEAEMRNLSREELLKAWAWSEKFGK
jgi:hypothetical protein